MLKAFSERFVIIVGFCCLLLLSFASGCSDRQEKQQKVEPPRGELKLGIIPEQNIFTQKKRYEPLAAYLSKRVGMELKIEILSRYGNIINNFISGDMDAAFFGSFTGALAIKKLGVEPLARPEYIDGTSTYYGLVFVRKDSGIKNAQDMKGKRFAFVDKATTAGWLLPLHYLEEQGITDYSKWLGEVYFTGTHEDAIHDVLNGRADIGAAKNTVFYRLAKKDSRLESELRILATSPKVPANGLLVSKDLDHSLKMKLKEALLNMDKNPEGQQVLKDFGAIKFIETSVEDYKPVFEYADHIGLDLATYDYMNE